MVEQEINTNAVNTYFLIYEIFDGDAVKALQKARKFTQSRFTMTPKSIERHLIIEYIEAGSTDEEIIYALSDDEHKIRPERLERIRKEYEDGKFRDR